MLIKYSKSDVAWYMTNTNDLPENQLKKCVQFKQHRQIGTKIFRHLDFLVLGQDPKHPGEGPKNPGGGSTPWLSFNDTSLSEKTLSQVGGTVAVFCVFL